MVTKCGTRSTNVDVYKPYNTSLFLFDVLSASVAITVPGATTALEHASLINAAGMENAALCIDVVESIKLFKGCWNPTHQDRCSCPLSTTGLQPGPIGFYSGCSDSWRRTRNRARTWMGRYGWFSFPSPSGLAATLSAFLCFDDHPEYAVTATTTLIQIGKVCRSRGSPLLNASPTPLRMTTTPCLDGDRLTSLPTQS